MSEPLFEHRYRSDTWRLSIASYNGREFADWRGWYAKDGELRPGRQGCTIPLERLAELHAAIGAWLAAEGLNAP